MRNNTFTSILSGAFPQKQKILRRKSKNRIGLEGDRDTDGVMQMDG
jgi:hypothetical protein